MLLKSVFDVCSFGPFMIGHKQRAVSEEGGLAGSRPYGVCLRDLQFRQSLRADQANEMPVPLRWAPASCDQTSCVKSADKPIFMLLLLLLLPQGSARMLISAH